MMHRDRERARRLGLEEHVLANAARMGRTLSEYQAVAALPLTKVLRYEDYIFKKAELIRIVAAHFGWRVDDTLTGLILSWADIVPAVEDPQAFVRKVTPGDHRSKLGSEAITRLDRVLAGPLEVFGYT
jgi:hypothetical protein